MRQINRAIPAVVVFGVMLLPMGLFAQNTFPASGNVGIGTTGPTSLLTADTPSTATPSLASNAFGTFRFSGAQISLIGGVSAASPYPFWLQTRNNTVDGYSYPLVLNPLGGNVGIGTPAPGYRLQVNGSNSTAPQSASIVASGYQSSLSVLNQAATANWYFGVNDADANKLYIGQGYSSQQNSTTYGQRLVIDQAGNVGIGTTNPLYKLSVRGTIGAGEIIVTSTSGWADYVFQPSYRLRPLTEVAAYIRANHHLPGIPSEAEVTAQGFSLGEMQSKLLAKVEELTLHAIQSEQRSTGLEERNARLEQQNRELQERVARLESQPAQADRH